MHWFSLSLVLCCTWQNMPLRSPAWMLFSTSAWDWTTPTLPPGGGEWEKRGWEADNSVGHRELGEGWNGTRVDWTWWLYCYFSRWQWVVIILFTKPQERVWSREPLPFYFWPCRFLVVTHGLLSSCSVRDSHCGDFSCCRAQEASAVTHGLSNRGPRAWLPCGSWDPSSQVRDRTCAPYIGRRILNHWATGEVPPLPFCCLLHHWHHLKSPCQLCLRCPTIWLESD